VNKAVAAALGVISAGGLVLAVIRKSGDKLATALPENPERRIADRASQKYMMYVALPAWSVAGALDWLWHRQTKIETTSGPKESFLHLMMMAESGTSVLAGLFLKPNAGLFAVMTAGMLLHQATVVWDVEYAVSRRKIPAREQHTHTFMETFPFDILMVFASLHPDPFKSMLGLGARKPDFSIHLRRPLLPLSRIAAILGAVTLFTALPHVEEFIRCWRAYRRGLTGSDTPRCSRANYILHSA
jgi:hypothetical protein